MKEGCVHAGMTGCEGAREAVDTILHLNLFVISFGRTNEYIKEMSINENLNTSGVLAKKIFITFSQNQDFHRRRKDNDIIVKTRALDPDQVFFSGSGFQISLDQVSAL